MINKDFIKINGETCTANKTANFNGKFIGVSDYGSELGIRLRGEDGCHYMFRLCKEVLEKNGLRQRIYDAYHHRRDVEVKYSASEKQSIPIVISARVQGGFQ